MKNNEVAEQNSGKGRRRFIKSAATISAFSILPAQSVWGACTISGAVSGNQSRVGAQCTFPNVSGGRSPGTWKKFVQNNETKKKNKAHAIFSAVQTSKQVDSNNRYKCIRDVYVDEVEDVTTHQLFSAATFDYAASLAAPNVASMIPNTAMSVEDGLRSNGGGDGDNNIYYHAASAYMNAYFGMYATVPMKDATAAAAVASEVFTYWLFERSHPKPRDVNLGSLLAYNDGITTYAVDPFKLVSCPAT